MHFFKRLLNLQLFADGSAAGGEAGEGQAMETGESAAEAAAQRLRELGVPEERLQRRAKNKAKPEPSIVIQRETDATEPAPDHAADDQQEAKPTKMSWAEIMKDPEYNAEMQKTIQQRLKGSKDQEAKLNKLQSVIDTLSDFYGIDDIDDLVSRVTNDDRYYQDEAERLDTTPEVARKLKQADRAKEQAERQAAAEAARQAESEREQATREHFMKLQEQGERLKQTIPTFDLQTELQNEKFLRLTAPGSGLSVEDAYYAIHRTEMMQQGMTQATINAERRLSRAMQANAARPVENGMGAQASSLSRIDYRSMSNDQRQQLRNAIHQAAGRGEKIYPHNIFKR